MKDDHFCKKCLTCLPINNFYKNKSKPHGRSYICKFCMKKYKQHRSQNPLTQRELKRILNYNPDTGIFIWSTGKPAGGLLNTGYRVITINYNVYLAHHLVYLYMTGELPVNVIDHINRNPSDNRWNNLRQISQKGNAINTGVRKNSTTGVTGVNFDSFTGSYKVIISVNGKEKNIGRYISFENAVRARYYCERNYGYSKYNTESPAYTYLESTKLI